MKNLQIKILLLFLSFYIISCHSQKKIERENQSTIYKVTEDDIEMNKAIEKAKQTLDSFDYAFKNNNRIFTFFGLKKRFEENGKIEHIWIGNIQKFEKGKYIGVIDNFPEIIKGIKLLDTVEIEKKDISDWMYIQNSELRGGYTLRLLRDRMTVEERKKFDAQSRIKIK
ncbi:YegJ family protein [Flavobacterium sp. FlaQc-50]|jgi:uncharacterized protein YegJ (DUF2314 family)|uniref:YegJ family protein n=1 Tax=unclassified Flavobacterium TaxID=196869 RepID=UPI00375763E7